MKTLQIFEKTDVLSNTGLSIDFMKPVYKGPAAATFGRIGRVMTAFRRTHQLKIWVLPIEKENEFLFDMFILATEEGFDRVKKNVQTLLSQKRDDSWANVLLNSTSTQKVTAWMLMDDFMFNNDVNGEPIFFSYDEAIVKELFLFIRLGELDNKRFEHGDSVVVAESKSLIETHIYEIFPEGYAEVFAGGKMIKKPLSLIYPVNGSFFITRNVRPVYRAMGLY